MFLWYFRPLTLVFLGFWSISWEVSWKNHDHKVNISAFLGGDGFYHISYPTNCLKRHRSSITIPDVGASGLIRDDQTPQRVARRCTTGPLCLRFWHRPEDGLRWRASHAVCPAWWFGARDAGSATVARSKHGDLKWRFNHKTLGLGNF